MQSLIPVQPCAMQVSDGFDGGAIELLGVDEVAGIINLNLRADSAAAFRQWFFFRVTGAKGREIRLVFENASCAAYPEGWEGYTCVASYDRTEWFRITSTAYTQGRLVVKHQPLADSVYYAYGVPYSYERHLDLLGRIGVMPGVQIQSIGRTVEGRDMDLVVIGDPGAGLPPVWIIARQHPGETMAEWFIEGLLERLTDVSDPVARAVRQQCTLYVVPNMNPDGAIHGNLRTNAAGRNLNREWLAPDPAASPEVFWVRQYLEKTGCSLFLDIHGDEGLPYVFFSTAEDVPGFTAEMAQQQACFTQALLRVSPDFQSAYGYQSGRFGEELLTLASKWVAHRFQCLSLTLEMPFKDNANLPDSLRGWDGERSKRLGGAMLHPVLEHLRTT